MDMGSGLTADVDGDVRPGGDDDPVLDWEARMTYDIGVILTRYMREQPCPGPSLRADDVSLWGERLRRLGEEKLEARSVRRLTAA